MKHNIRYLMAAFLMCVMLICPSFAISSFPDVDEHAEYAEAINYLADHGIFMGDDHGNFEPNMPVTRAEMAVIMCNVLNEDVDYGAETSFIDVPGWASPYVAKVASLGFVSGYGNGLFGPSDCVTYEQAVTMIVRSMGRGSDAAARGGYPEGYLSVAEEMGVNLYALKGKALSRADVAMVLYSFIKPRSTVTKPESTVSVVPGVYEDVTYFFNTLTIHDIREDGTLTFSVCWYRAADIENAVATLDGNIAVFSYQVEGAYQAEGYLEFINKETVVLNLTKTEIPATEIETRTYQISNSPELELEDYILPNLLENNDSIGWINPIIVDQGRGAFIRFYPDGSIKYWITIECGGEVLAYENKGAFVLQGNTLIIDGYKYDMIVERTGVFSMYLTAIGDDPQQLAGAYKLEADEYYEWLNLHSWY